MDFSKNFSISTDYKDRKAPLEWDQRILAKVILIDKTTTSTRPSIYQLKDNALDFPKHNALWKLDHNAILNDAFVFLGEALRIDKKNKQIFLEKNQIVSYQYLVVAWGSKPTFYGCQQEHEFSAGIQALIDALRVRDKIPSSFATLATYNRVVQLKPSHWNYLDPSHEGREKISHTAINSNIDCVPFDLATINKRLYEVQV